MKLSWRIESEKVIRTMSITRLKRYLQASNKIHDAQSRDDLKWNYPNTISDKTDPRLEETRNLCKKVLDEKEMDAYLDGVGGW